jgi:membrane associated rhomboid family serine protease
LIFVSKYLKYRTAIIHSRVELPASMEASDHDKSFVDPEPNIPRNIKTEENFDDDQDKSFVDSKPTIPSNVKTAEASDDQDKYFVASEPKIPFNIRTAEGSDDSYEEELAQQQWQTPLPVRRPASGSNRPSREVGRPEVATQSRNTQPKNTNNELLRHLFRNDVTDDPALARRLRDFTFAQQKRRETYGYRNPWGIIGLYDHLTGIRVDIEWAEDAAWRREHEEPYLSWADFESAKDSGLNQPFFTYIIMFICTGCLILSIGVNGWKIESLTVNPMIGPSAQTLIDVGAKKTSLIVNDNEWFRLFSPMFLHAGVIHYVLNMLALWFVGSAVEMNHGFINAAILFIIPAIGGTIMSALFLPEYISVGASGGIFGLIGGCIADIVSNWNLLFSKVVNPVNDGKRFRHFWVLIWLLLDILLVRCDDYVILSKYGITTSATHASSKLPFQNVVIGLTPFVDNFTHLGGMVYGFLCGLGKLERLSHLFFGVKKGFLSKFQSSLVRFFGFILSIVCIIITSFVLLRSDGEKITNCRGCRYVSCVPFPFWAEKQDKVRGLR